MVGAVTKAGIFIPEYMAIPFDILNIVNSIVPKSTAYLELLIGCSVFRLWVQLETSYNSQSVNLPML